MAVRRWALLVLLLASLVAAACNRATDESAPAADDATTVTVPTTVAVTAPPPPTTSTAAATDETPTTTSAPRASEPGRLETRRLWLFPGPDHFEGDVLSAQVSLGDFADRDLGEVTVAVDGEVVEAEAHLGRDPLLGDYITVTDAVDTRNAAGQHRISIVAEIDGEPFQVAAQFMVLPAAERPQQERNAAWASIETACCTVHFVERSAAARDMSTIAALIDDSAATVGTALGVAVPHVDIVLLDVLWGNGGYAGGHEVAISYLDRDFGPTTDETAGMIFVHELTHGAARELAGDAPWPFDEALAVYVSGGHFKPENLPARAAALEERGELLPVAAFLDGFDGLQHESRYVQAGALATYLVDTYGWDRFIELYTTPTEGRSVSQWFDRTAEGVFAADLDEIQEGFSSWVAAQDASLEARDLDLTISLQEARRRYQAEYAAYQSSFLRGSVVGAGNPSLALRESRHPAHAATEALFAWAQRLIVDGELDRADQVVTELEAVVASGLLDGRYAAAAMAIAEKLDTRGYELLSVDFHSDTAAVRATAEHPIVVDFVADLSGAGVDLIGPVIATS